MAGEVERVDVSVEGRILGNLITSGELLGKVRPIVDPTLFESPVSRIVAQWVIDYFDRLHEAPGKAITDVYIARREELNEADAGLVKAFLKNCSATWKPTNVAFAEGMATRFFQGRSLDRLIENLKTKAGGGNIEGAQRLIAEYVKPELVHSRSIDLLRGGSASVSAIQHAFQNDDEELFALRGGMNKLVGGPLCRGELVAFLAPPKSGKTWWMIDTAIAAMTRGQRVLFVSLEMTEDQVVRRFWQSLSARSRFGEKAPGSAFQQNGNKWDLVEGERSTARVELDGASIEAVQKTYLQTGDGDLKIRCYPPRTLTLQKLRSELKVLEVFENFVPDVIVLDYGDIMALPPGRERRLQLDELWLGLRNITLEMNNLIVTASQTNRETIGGKRDADETNTAECASKVNHVTRMITINRSPRDKKLGIYRMSCQTMRDGRECFESLVVVNCLEIGRPWMDDRFMGEVNFPREHGEEDEN